MWCGIVDVVCWMQCIERGCGRMGFFFEKFPKAKPLSKKKKILIGEGGLGGSRPCHHVGFFKFYPFTCTNIILLHQSHTTCTNPIPAPAPAPAPHPTPTIPRPFYILLHPLHPPTPIPPSPQTHLNTHHLFFSLQVCSVKKCYHCISRHQN